MVQYILSLKYFVIEKYFVFRKIFCREADKNLFGQRIVDPEVLLVVVGELDRRLERELRLVDLVGGGDHGHVDVVGGGALGLHGEVADDEGQQVGRHLLGRVKLVSELKQD